MRATLRFVIGILVAVAVLVAIVPLLVLLDLGGGGSGWGLCDPGIAGCRNSYFAGFEMIAWLAFVLFALVALIGVCVRLLRMVDKRARSPVRPAAVIGSARSGDQTPPGRRPGS
jgi:hypothetical protein